MLWQRIITALILFLIAIFAVIYLPNTYFAIATALLLSLAAWEWLKLIKISKKQIIIYFIALWVAFAVASMLSPIFTLTVGGVAWIGALYFVCRYPKINKKILTGWSGCGLSLLVFVPCWVGFNVLRDYDIEYIFAVLVMDFWAADIGAYFIGRFFGKHQLASEVSPKKTIEGFVGGMLLAFIVYVIYFLVISSTFNWVTVIWISKAIFYIFCLYLLLAFGKSIWAIFTSKIKQSNFKQSFKLSFWELVFAIIIVIIYSLIWETSIDKKNWVSLFSTVFTVVTVVAFSVVGDLFESVLKRIAGVKDSGTWLPGHGGVLDRIDSLLAAVPVYALEFVVVSYLVNKFILDKLI